MVANDGSPGGEKAVLSALDLAKRLGVGLTMVCVEAVDRFPAVVDVVPEAQSEPASSFDPIVEADNARAREMGVEFEAQITGGHPVQRIIEIIEQDGYDLLVVGHTGHTALYERIIGSVADRLVLLAPCNVMVVR